MQGDKPRSRIQELAAQYATSPYSAYSLSALFVASAPIALVAAHKDSNNPALRSALPGRTPLAKLLDANSLEQAVRKQTPVLRKGLAPAWQLLGLGGLIGLGGYIIHSGDPLNGAGTVTAWSLCYLAFNTVPSLRSSKPLPIALTLATATFGAGLHGAYYFDKTSWQGALPGLVTPAKSSSSSSATNKSEQDSLKASSMLLLTTAGLGGAASRRGPGRSIRGLFSGMSRYYSSPSVPSSKSIRFVKPLDPETIPKGFAAAYTHAGIKAAISPKPVPEVVSSVSSAATSAAATLGLGPKAAPPKPDLALIVSTSSEPAAAAGTFTRNVFKAAPVVLSSQILAGGADRDGARARAILINSGCANAVTGQRGLDDARRCDAEVAAALDRPTEKTLLLSTGVIGVPLPMDAISPRLRELAQRVQETDGKSASTPEVWHETSRAFMTTDTFPKLRTHVFKLGNKEYRMLGIDKGAGMIHPSMGGINAGSNGSLHATLLGFIATDAPIAPPALQQALEHAVERSFNCISVDGDMSTNDTILALANGPRSEEIGTDSPAFAVFQRELTTFCIDLAQLIVRDGEGAEKFVEINVKSAPSYGVAHAIASSISTSALVKCALHGGDANWGRILCAVGYAKLPLTDPAAGAAQKGQWSIDPAKVTVRFLPPPSAPTDASFAPLTVLKDGAPQAVDEAEASRLLALEDIVIEVDLQGGSWGDGGDSTAARESHEATYWTCDFSKEYVAINGDYRS